MPLSVEARNKLIEENIPLVQKLANSIKSRLPKYVSYDDIYGAGIKGLVDAASRYNPEENNKFWAYAILRIRGEMMDELRRTDINSPHQRREYNKITKAIDELQQKLSRQPSDEEVAEYFELSISKFRKWRSSVGLQTLFSLNAPVSTKEYDSIEIIDIIEDENAVSGVDMMEQLEGSDLLLKLVERLDDVEKNIVEKYFFQGVKLWEIADSMKVTDSRVSQILKQALVKMRRAHNQSHAPVITPYSKTQDERSLQESIH